MFLIKYFGSLCTFKKKQDKESFEIRIHTNPKNKRPTLKSMVQLARRKNMFKRSIVNSVQFFQIKLLKSKLGQPKNSMPRCSFN